MRDEDTAIDAGGLKTLGGDLAHSALLAALEAIMVL